MSTFKANLKDSAVALAKKWQHAEVESKHLAAALLQELDELVPEAANALLSPRGDSLRSPELGADAVKLLEACVSPKSAADALAAAGFGALGDRRKAVSDEIMPEESPKAETRTLEEVNADLDTLVGLEHVKQELRQLADVHRLNAERVKAGLGAVPVGRHLVFTGAPGTGKTTVARLVAEMYRALGLLRRGHLVEVHRADLVAAYVGQTAQRVTKVVQSARGGVLFIDEAYALLSEGSDYGPEAVATLVKLMEDHREDLAVIVAGYPEPMQAFIESNAGLHSRFGRFVHFENYSPGELTEIFQALADKMEIRVGDGLLDRVRQAVRQAPPETRSGNGRFVRNMFEQAYARMASRATADGVIEADELVEMRPEDVEVVAPRGENDDFPGNYL